MVKNIYIENDNSRELEGIKLLIEDKILNQVDNVENADIVYYSSLQNKNDKMKILHYLFNNKYKHIKFIFGPNVEKLPDQFSNVLKNTNKNIYINVMSEWNKKLWENMKYTNVPLITLPSPIDRNIFKENKTDIKKTCFVYIKKRKYEDYDYILELLEQTKYIVEIIREEDNISNERFIEILNKSVFGVWISDEEYQNHRLLQALCCNIPILVNDINDIVDNKTSVPYWIDGLCGKKYKNKNDFEKTIRDFIIDLNNYEPRQYVLDNFTTTAIYNNYWMKELDIVK